jgi:hypothetical protein
VQIGTGFLNGESETHRGCGRLYVVEITSVVGEEGYDGRSIYKLKEKWSSEDLQVSTPSPRKPRPCTLSPEP